MIKVTVWNEYLEELQYEHVAKVYPNGIHECIREFLSSKSYRCSFIVGLGLCLFI